MTTGWKCPNCGSAHAPTVLTCPAPAKDVVGSQRWPILFSIREPNYYDYGRSNDWVPPPYTTS
jgi:hypothetical protein